jgi:hypothetical protein
MITAAAILSLLAITITLISNILIKRHFARRQRQYDIDMLVIRACREGALRPTILAIYDRFGVRPKDAAKYADFYLPIYGCPQ